MAKPNLEGLRLALLDGNEISIRRSDDGDFNPFLVPEHWIRAVEVHEARCMGRGKPARIECSPFFNAIVGGRGTGKSTLVHALRQATGREAELPEDSEPRSQFKAFTTVCKGRDGKGALLNDTTISVEWQRAEDRSRLRWSAKLCERTVHDWSNGQWTQSPSQVASPERFPLRLFSQGQIAALAGEGRQTLLSIIDEAAGVTSLRSEFDDARRTFFAQRARLRELSAKVAGLPELERQLQEMTKKLEVLASSDHAAVLRAFALAKSQQREVGLFLSQTNSAVERLKTVAESLTFDRWNSEAFSEQRELLAWRGDVEADFNTLRGSLQEQVKSLREQLDQRKTDGRHHAWLSQVDAANKAHAALQEQLTAQGVQDPHAFERMTHERQDLETRRKELLLLESEKQGLLSQLDSQRSLLTKSRLAITDARRAFLAQVLKDNPHVRITIVRMGYEPRQLERELRGLLDAQDDKFAREILSNDNGDRPIGLAVELSDVDEAKKLELLAVTKDRLCAVTDDFGAVFRNFLRKKHDRPEFADQILAWYPEDDLKLEYQRDGQWNPIEEGSQGQRSAALLAFLLAFGNEPLILDQPEDDLDNHLIYDLIVKQIRANKLRRQLFIVTHNANVVVNGDAELVHVMQFGKGQCIRKHTGALQQEELRKEVCRVMEGGHEAFTRRWKRLGLE